MTWVPPETKVTKPGPNGPVVLTARVWSLLAEVEKRAGLKPGTLVVTQGSYRPRTTYSGTVHTGGGTLDLRTWNITHAAAMKVIAGFRGFGDPAWFRDKDHGGFAPHIHIVVADEPDLSASARWQVKEYRAGRDGLTSAGPDYHPQPALTEVYNYPPDPIPPAAPWGGKPIGWASLQRPQIRTAQIALRTLFPDVKVTGTYLPIVDRAFRIAVGKYQAAHPDATELDGDRAGVIGEHLYASILTRYPTA